MEADQDRDGKISFEEFTKMVEGTDVSMSMTLGKFSLSLVNSSFNLRTCLVKNPSLKLVLLALRHNPGWSPYLIWTVSLNECEADANTQSKSDDYGYPTTAFYLSVRLT